VDSLAKRAARSGRRPNIKIPYSDFQVEAKESLSGQFRAYLEGLPEILG